MSEAVPKYQSADNQNNTVVLQFVGDIGLNNLFCDPKNYRTVKRNMSELAASLGECDVRVGNLETPLWGDGGINVHKQPYICTTLGAAECIVPFRLDVAVMANNHVYDCLEKGFENTLSFLEQNGISHLGAGTSEAEAKKPLIMTRKKLKIGLLSYVGSETNPCIPPDAGIFLNVIDEDRLLTEVADLATHVDIVVLNLHWGIELVRYPSPEQRRLARRAVEAGAKVVACHHSHRLQGYERWKNGCIFYSLGNFLYLKGKGPMQWPKVSRRTAVATCVVSKTEVKQAYLTNLLQEGLTLRQDETRSREKRQNRLNKALKLPDAKYKRLWRREVFWQWSVVAFFRFIRTSGGLRKALSRFRWQHVVKAFEVLTTKT